MCTRKIFYGHILKMEIIESSEPKDNYYTYEYIITNHNKIISRFSIMREKLKNDIDDDDEMIIHEIELESFRLAREQEDYDIINSEIEINDINVEELIDKMFCFFDEKYSTVKNYIFRDSRKYYYYVENEQLDIVNDMNNKKILEYWKISSNSKNEACLYKNFFQLLKNKYNAIEFHNDYAWLVNKEQISVNFPTKKIHDCIIKFGITANKLLCLNKNDEIEKHDDNHFYTLHKRKCYIFKNRVVPEKNPVNIINILFDKPIIIMADDKMNLDIYFKFFIEDFEFTKNNLYPNPKSFQEYFSFDYRLNKCVESYDHFRVHTLNMEMYYVYGIKSFESNKDYIIYAIDDKTITIAKQQNKIIHFPYQKILDMFNNVKNTHGFEKSKSISYENLKLANKITNKNSDMDNQKFNYIYLLQEREFCKTNEQIYKIGKTTKTMQKRFSQYPKNSSILFAIEVNDCHQKEREIIADLKTKFKQRVDIGTEYFEGNKHDLIRNIYELCMDIDICDIDELELQQDL
jgi:hypothetical protein